MTDSIFDSEVLNPNYIIYRRDRSTTYLSGSDGGGVLIAVSKQLQSRRVHHYESTNEDIWVSIKVGEANNLKPVNICAVYLQCPVSVSILDSFLDNINNIMCANGDNTIVLGDFNMYNSIDWTPNIMGGEYGLEPLNYNCNLSYSLVDFISHNNFCQFNHVRNANDRILDLVLCNFYGPSVRNKCNDPLSKIDPHHPPIEIDVNLCSPMPLANRVFATHNFRKADYTAINDKLSKIDWNNSINNHDLDAMVSNFYSILQAIIEECVPKTKSRNVKYPIWFSKPLIRTLAEKEKIRRRYNTYNNPRDGFELKLLSKRADKLISADYKSYINNIESSIKSNPKYFWTFIKSQRNNSSSLPSSMQLLDKSAETGSDICNLFSSHFSSTFTISNFNNITVCPPVPPCLDSLYKIELSEETILGVINNINASKGAGPDGIPPMFIKKSAKILTVPLKIIFNKSLSNGSFPAIWKLANVIPVYKKGDRTFVNNYRPISILSAFPKIFEAAVVPFITKFFKPILSEHQHGFTSNRSTSTNLLTFITDITKSVDSHDQVDAIYTDFSSAFDKVDHNILLRKISDYGINGSLLNWLQSYLSNRTQRVTACGYNSVSYKVTSGVPQGSHIGPILFLMFINDICNYIRHSNYSLFADDLKLYKVVKNSDDVLHLQKDLDAVQLWCTHNNMSLNVTKCQHIKFTRKINPLPSAYNLQGTNLQVVNVIRDLGILIDSKLTFNNHIDHIVKNSMKMLGFIKRNCKDFKGTGASITLYNTLVRSQLEYAAAVWNPSYKTHIVRLEKVQRNFSRFIAHKSRDCPYRSDYSGRLSHFNMLSLEKRRKLLDLTTLYNISNNNYDCSELLGHLNFFVPRPSARDSCRRTFDTARSNTNLGKFSTFNRMMSLYNDIAYDSVNLDLFCGSLRLYKECIGGLVSGLTDSWT